MNEAAYIATMKPEWGTSYKLLKPTGRWKLKWGVHQEAVMYVEHQGWLFKSWVHESNLVFHPAPREEIFECQ